MTRLDNDLKSRKALLEELDKTEWRHIKQSIINAPTVETDNGEPVAWALFYENGVVNHVTKWALYNYMHLNQRKTKWVK